MPPKKRGKLSAPRPKSDVNPMTLYQLIQVLQEEAIEHGNIPVIQSTDEEGNRFSPVVLRGIVYHSDTKNLCFYPLLPEIAK